LPGRIRSCQRRTGVASPRPRHRADPDSPPLGGDAAHAPAGAHADRDHTRGTPCGGRRERATGDERHGHETTRQTKKRQKGGETVTAGQRYVVACLAGDGIGPEVMAEASRALGEVSSLHGFRIDEVHPPFGGEALSRAGHPLPPATRQATLTADAVLVAG